MLIFCFSFNFIFCFVYLAGQKDKGLLYLWRKLYRKLLLSIELMSIVLPWSIRNCQFSYGKQPAEQDSASICSIVQPSANVQYDVLRMMIKFLLYISIVVDYATNSIDEVYQIRWTDVQYENWRCKKRMNILKIYTWIEKLN